MHFGIISKHFSNYLAFQNFDIERTWWRLFQNHTVGTKFHKSVFIQPYYYWNSANTLGIMRYHDKLYLHMIQILYTNLNYFHTTEKIISRNPILFRKYWNYTIWFL